MSDERVKKPVLKHHTFSGQPRCLRVTGYGSNRTQCSNIARPGEVYCAIHSKPEIRKP